MRQPSNTGRWLNGNIMVLGVGATLTGASENKYALIAITSW